MTFQYVQALRAVAALMVVISHSFWPIERLRSHWLAPWADSIGPAGVDLFFVISGFVVSLSAHRLAVGGPANGRLRAFREFTVRRLVRIYPIYWIVFLLASTLMTSVELAPDWIEHKPWQLLALLLDQPNDRILAAWTLQFEIMFYAATAGVLLLLPSRLLAVMSVWFALIVAGSAFVPALSNTQWLNPIILEFIFGVYIGWLARMRFTKWGRVSMLAGAFAFLVGAYVFQDNGGWFTLPSIWRVMCFGVPSAMIVYGLVAHELKNGSRVPRFIKALGDASYSIYLWHQLLFACLAIVLGMTGTDRVLPGVALLLSLIGLACVAGLLSHKYLEKPINDSSVVRCMTGRDDRPSVSSSSVL